MTVSFRFSFSSKTYAGRMSEHAILLLNTTYGIFLRDGQVSDFSPQVKSSHVLKSLKSSQVTLKLIDWEVR
jgi:hypothetical protein